MPNLLKLFDPMVRLLLAALVLAFVLPVQGAALDIAHALVNCGVFALFLLNGLKLSRVQVVRGLTDWRYHGTLALFVFGVMVLGGWAGWQVAEGVLPPVLALGFLYLGGLPSTVQSATAYTSLAEGNVAHAVVGAAMLNVLGVFVSAPLFAALAGESGFALQSSVLIKVGAILLLPFALGQILQPRFGHLVTERPQLTRWFDRGVIAMSVYVAMSGAVADGVAQLLEADQWAWLAGIAVALLAVATLAAWLVPSLLGMGRPDRIAFMFAGSQKSIAMGAPLATILFDAQTAGLILLPILTYHFAQLVLAAPLAERLRGPVSPA